MGDRSPPRSQFDELEEEDVFELLAEAVVALAEVDAVLAEVLVVAISSS